jgi:MFS family permease
LSNSFGGLIAAGLVSGLEGKGGLEGWRWLFIVEGAITVFVGIAVYFILPSYPSKTKFFSEEQRRLAVWRTTQDANGEPDEGGETSLVKGAKLVIKDWKVSLEYRRRYATILADHPLFPFQIDPDVDLSTNVHFVQPIVLVLRKTHGCE